MADAGQADLPMSLWFRFETIAVESPSYVPSTDMREIGHIVQSILSI